mmetsp:Transcript_22577/g.47803  ORF Transcript_22577/g.47803 Transcript_22577/m.47803 type:complete len:212 (-) Transcript_22577:1356-1991(-)
MTSRSSLRLLVSTLRFSISRRRVGALSGAESRSFFSASSLAISIRIEEMASSLDWIFMVESSVWLFSFPFSAVFSLSKAVRRLFSSSSISCRFSSEIFSCSWSFALCSSSLRRFPSTLARTFSNSCCFSCSSSRWDFLSASNSLRWSSRDLFRSSISFSRSSSFNFSASFFASCRLLILLFALGSSGLLLFFLSFSTASRYRATSASSLTI